MIIDEEVYLEHFGVKGMKWGVRNFRNTQKKRKLNKYGDKKAKPLTKSQKESRKDRTITRAIIGTRMAVGAAFVAAMYASRDKGKLPPGFRLRDDGPGARTATQIINAERNTQISSLKRTFREGHIDKTQLQNFKEVLNKRYDRRIREAASAV